MMSALANVPDDSVFVHGECEGADVMSRIVLGRRCFEVKVPYSKRHGTQGGPIRNQLMVDMGVAYKAAGYEVRVYAFPMPTSRGTFDLIRRARAAGLDVVETVP